MRTAWNRAARSPGLELVGEKFRGNAHQHGEDGRVRPGAVPVNLQNMLVAGTEALYGGFWLILGKKPRMFSDVRPAEGLVKVDAPDGLG